jgi:hypothetical protein
MSWTSFLSRWWHRTPPAHCRFADPFDYALAFTLPGTFRGERAAPAQPAFLALLPAHQVAVARQLAELQELDHTNLGSLLWQAFVATR